MTSNRYRQRPNECDAIQWTGDNADELRAFAGSDFDTIDSEDRIEDPDCDAQLLVEASHWVAIRPTDWVLKFEGYFVAKADVPFRAVWEPARAAAALRDRIAEALKGVRVWRTIDGCEGWEYAGTEALAAAVLAVFPEPPSRAAIEAAAFRAAANYVRGHSADERYGKASISTALCAVSDELYRWADDAAGPSRVAAEAQQQPETEAPRSTAPLAAGLPLVKGNCPACRGASLFLGTGGYPTCSNHECPEPDAATTVLEQYANEAHPPQHAWRVETRDPLANEWAPGSHFASRPHAVERYETANSTAPLWRDGTPVERRIVRETTTYTVEEPAPESAAADSEETQTVARRCECGHLQGIHIGAVRGCAVPECDCTAYVPASPPV